MNRYSAAVIVVLFLQFGSATLASADVAFSWATVGNAGNAADPETGRGAVAYDYRIATTEVTNSQYTDFLNAVDPFATNQRGLYNPFMNQNFGGGGILNTGTTDGARYSVSPGFEQNPVSLVSWYDAARFVNWLHNGQHSGSTETGVYTILGGTATPSNASSIVRNAGARYFIPTQDEWYKAAFHDPTAGTAGAYFDYATRTNTIPFSDNPATLNTPNNANVANYFNLDGSANGYNDGYAMTGTTTIGAANPYNNVGAYTLAASPYGTFDQNGNVREWNETLIVSTARGIRGGSWSDSANTNAQSLIAIASDSVSGASESGLVGFRIASALAIPDPTNYILTVEYQTPEIEGPLVQRFNPLPSTIVAKFLLRNVYPGQTSIGRDQVITFDLEIPGDNATEEDLQYFQLSLDTDGTPSGLTWGAQKNDNELGAIILQNSNFHLSIIGTDPNTNEPFTYHYTTSTHTFTAVPEPTALVVIPIAFLLTLTRRRSENVRI